MSAVPQGRSPQQVPPKVPAPPPPPTGQRTDAGIRAEERHRLAAEIKAWRDKNDFARPPDWWQAIDAVLDIVEPGEGGA